MPGDLFQRDLKYKVDFRTAYGGVIEKWLKIRKYATSPEFRSAPAFHALGGVAAVIFFLPELELQFLKSNRWRVPEMGNLVLRHGSSWWLAMRSSSAHYVA